MAIQIPKSIRKFAPSIIVMIVCALLTAGAYVFQQRSVRDKISLHAAADAAQSQRALELGIRSYVQLSRDIAGFIVASEHLTAINFDTYMRSTDVLHEHPGLRYIGYVPRVARASQADFEARRKLETPGYQLKPAAADPDYVYPYLYAYPRDTRTLNAQGLDFSAIPQRWAAMQRARDSGVSAVTSKNSYMSGAEHIPIIIVFTPIYDLGMPISTTGERRAALRGYVFSIYEVEEVVARVMGPRFEELFDLEIYDGDATQQNLLYDGDKRPHVVMQDEDFPIANRANVKVCDHIWQMYFFPKPSYGQRYRNGQGLTILLLGMLVTGAMGYGAHIAVRRLRWRSRQSADAHRFDAVFLNHPSAVYALNLRGRFINANAHALREFKSTKEELLKKIAQDLIVTEYRERSQAQFISVLKGHTVSFESAIFDNDGARVEVCIIMIPVKLDGRVTSVLGIAENVTERKLTELRLTESKRMLRLVINHIPQRVFWKDTELRYLGCNEAFCRDAGLTHPDQIIGKSDFELAWRENAADYQGDDRATIASNHAKINFEEGQQREDGSEYWLRTSKIPLSNMDGKTVAVLGLYEDITDRKLMERQLKEMAHYDSLTGLANRAFFHHHLDHLLAKAKRSETMFAVMYLDLDKFKSVNDTYGHEVGDRLLQAFAQRIRNVLREADVVARLGGDEFAFMLEDLPDRATAESVATKLLAAMQMPFSLGNLELRVGTSIGLAFSAPGVNAQELVRRADHAMYRAKHNGRNRFEIDQD